MRGSCNTCGHRNNCGWQELFSKPKDRTYPCHAWFPDDGCLVVDRVEERDSSPKEINEKKRQT